MLLAFQSPSGTAEVEGGHWHQLTRETRPPEDELPGPFAATREVVLTPVKGGVRVDARWKVRALRPGWFSGMLLGTDVEAHVERVRWNGKPAAFSTAREGSVVFGYVNRDTVIELRAFIPGDPARKEVEIDLLPAVSGEVRVAGTGNLRPRVRDRALGRQLLLHQGRFSTGGPTLALELLDPATIPSEATRPDLVVATAGLGLTVGEAELRGRAHIVWEVRHGTLERVSLTASGLGDDLQVEGPNVREWKRSGDRIEVELQEASRDRVDLQLRWTAPVPEGTESSLSLPRVEPHEAFRTESSVQLARDGEIEVLPELDGWQAVAASQLPEWGSGLVEGTPTASFTLAGTAGGELGLFRFVPVEGPPVVVDVAGYQVAASREGRLLMRAHYEVRNERAAHLRVQPPKGTRIIGAQVGGESALPARDSDGAWLIPLTRSVETVEGLLSFPVEVILMGEEDAWSRKDARKLRLPTLDAPVAASRVTVYLPPGYSSLLEPGEGDVVDGFTEGEGITYGLGVGEVGAGQADALFQQAVDAWLDNDFEAAQGRLDDLNEMGANNENIEKLQANLQVVRGGSTGKKVDVTMERRIKGQAKARAMKDLEAEREAKETAEELKKAGDYVAAEQEYRRALDIGRRLEMLEQSESVEQQTKNVAYEEKLAELEEDVERQKREIQLSSIPKQDKKASKKKGKRGPVGAKHPIGGSGDAGAVMKPPEDPAPTPADTIAGLDTQTSTITSRSRGQPGTVIDIDAISNMPVGSETSRDFTAAVGSVPAAARDTAGDADGEDAGGISLAGASAPEEDSMLEAIETEQAYEVDLADEAEPTFGTVAKVSLGGRVRSLSGRGRDRRANRRSSRGGGGGAGLGYGKAKAPAAARPKPTPQALPDAAVPPPPPAKPGPAAAPETPATGGDNGLELDGRFRYAEEVTVYDFEDDDLEGELWQPQGGEMLDPTDPLELDGKDAVALARLPDPTAHATAMSVTIPTAGEAVLYQRLLLAAGATFEVEIEAREPLRERKHR